MKSSVDRPTADEIAEMADSGRDISRFFTNQGTVKQPLTSISGDVTQERSYRRLRCVSAVKTPLTAASNAQFDEERRAARRPDGHPRSF